MISKFCIEINSDIKRFYDKLDEVDITDDVEENLHDSLFKVIEDFITGDDFEWLTLDLMADDEQRMPRSGRFDEFNKVGGIKITIHHPQVIEKSNRSPATDNYKLSDFGLDIIKGENNAGNDVEKSGQ